MMLFCLSAVGHEHNAFAALRKRDFPSEPLDEIPGQAAAMNKRILMKPDGRPLILYGRAPIPEGITAPSPSSGPYAPNAHLRWHPLRGEWVAYATHRQLRTGAGVFTADTDPDEKAAELRAVSVTID
jgi:hypothetical protein